MSIIPGSASLVNQVFSKFLATLPKARSDLVPPKTPVLDRTKMALRTLADLVGEPSYALRDPRSCLSFSCVSPEVVQSQLDNLKFYARDIDKAFCPLGRDGRPMRKSVHFLFTLSTLHRHIRFSERTQSHWFHGDHRGMSQIGARLAFPCGISVALIIFPLWTDTVEVLQTQKNHKSKSPERAVSGQLTANGNDCVTEDIAQDGRMRRTTFNTSSVEKQVVKGSINKVVTQSAGLKVIK